MSLLISVQNRTVRRVSATPVQGQIPAVSVAAHRAMLESITPRYNPAQCVQVSRVEYFIVLRRMADLWEHGFTLSDEMALQKQK